MPDDAQELSFPLSGVDVSCEVDRQTPRTTPRGVNVRACDPRSLRMRGGARAGLTKLVDETVSGSVGFPVQHLNMIVDPTVDALLANFPEVMSPPGDSMPDPSTNNAAGGSTDPDDPLVRNPDRTVRVGGSGIQPNRHLPRSQMRFIQKAENFAAFINPLTTSATFGTAVASGGLVVVEVWQYFGNAIDFGATVAVENGAGAAYTQIGTAVVANDGLTEANLTLWYRIAPGVVADSTVKATSSGVTSSGELLVVGLNYSGAHSSPLTASALNATFTPETTNPSAGSVALNGSVGQMVVAAFLWNYTSGGAHLWTPGAGYTARSGAPGSYFASEDRIGLSGFGPQVPRITVASVVLDAGICAAFKQA